MKGPFTMRLTMTNVLRAAALGGLFVLMAACAGSGANTAARGPCPDDGPRLPGTGLCKGRAANYLLGEPSQEPVSLLEGCSWTTGEATLNDIGVLYRTMSCKRRETKLEFTAGAQTAALTYKRSAVFRDIPGTYEPVRIFNLEGVTDPKAMILDMARKAADDQAEAAACEVRLANDDRFPPGALVVDVNDAWRKAKGLGEGDGPESDYAACGVWGISTSGLSYWMIRQGYAFHVDMGQDLPDFDPGSLTMMRRDEGGVWTAMPE
jgi:hypothetical protein